MRGMNLTKGKIHRLYRTQKQTAKKYKSKRPRKASHQRRKSFRGKRRGVNLERRTLKKYGGNPNEAKTLFQELPYSEMEIDNGEKATETTPVVDERRDSVSSVDTLPQLQNDLANEGDDAFTPAQPETIPSESKPFTDDQPSIPPPPPESFSPISETDVQTNEANQTDIDENAREENANIETDKDELFRTLIPPPSPPPEEMSPSPEPDHHTEEKVIGATDAEDIPFPPPSVLSDMSNNVMNDVPVEASEPPSENADEATPPEATLPTHTDDSPTTDAREKVVQSLTNIMDYLTDTISEKVSENILLSQDRPQNGFRSVAKMADTLATRGGTKRRRQHGAKRPNRGTKRRT